MSGAEASSAELKWALVMLRKGKCITLGRGGSRSNTWRDMWGLWQHSDRVCCQIQMLLSPGSNGIQQHGAIDVAAGETRGVSTANTLPYVSQRTTGLCVQGTTLASYTSASPAGASALKYHPCAG